MRTMQNVFMTLSVFAWPFQRSHNPVAATLPCQYGGDCRRPLDGDCLRALRPGRGLCGGISSTLALARNPGARPAIFLLLVLGLAFIESLALFTFAIILFKVK